MRFSASRGSLFHYADFELIDPKGSEPTPGATLRPKGGIPMRIKRRGA